MLFANNTEDDMFLRDTLEALAERHSNFKIWYLSCL
jgi:NAD(P)H-flavin reductase